MELTKNEKKVLDGTVQLWNSLLDLEVIHESERKEYEFLIHSIQSRIMSRPFRRLQSTPKRLEPEFYEYFHHNPPKGYNQEH